MQIHMREPNVTEKYGRQGGDGLPYNLFSSLCFAIRRDNGDITINFEALSWNGNAKRSLIPSALRSRLIK